MTNLGKTLLIGAALIGVHYLGEVQGYVKGACVTASAYIEAEEREKKLKTEDPE